MGVQEGELVGTVIEPDEVPTRVHQPHHELLGLPELATLFDTHLKEVHLRLISRTMNERDEHLSLLAAFLPKVVAHGGHANLVALLDELAVDPGAGDALLWGSSSSPLLQ